MCHVVKPFPALLHAIITLSIAARSLSNALESDSILTDAVFNGTTTETVIRTTMSTSYSTRNVTTTASSYSLSTQTTITTTASTVYSTQAHTHTTDTNRTHVTTNYSSTYTVASTSTVQRVVSNSSFSATSSTASSSMSTSFSSRTQTSSSRTARSTTHSTTSITSSSFSSSSSSTFSSTTASTTSTSTMTPSVTTETVTVTHTMQLSGKIALNVSSARAFTESLQVEQSACRALANIMFVNVQFVTVTLRLKQRRLQTSLRQGDSQGFVDLTYEVIIPFNFVEAETLFRARMAIIQATPRQIGRMLEVEVNSDSQATYRIEVVEVFPPTVVGSQSRTTLALGTTARGMLSDLDYSSSFRRRLSAASLFASALLSAAAPSFAAI